MNVMKTKVGKVKSVEEAIADKLAMKQAETNEMILMTNLAHKYETGDA